MQLHSIEIKNFRKLKNCKIRFKDATFLIGPNNAGKSSVFAALNHLHKNTNTSREDYSKTFNPEDASYKYAEEIEMVAEYRDVPEEANNWIGFRGRVTKKAPPTPDETGYAITYKKIWSLNQSKPKVYLLEHERSRSEKYVNAKKIIDLKGDDFTEEFLKEHFDEQDLTKPLTGATAKTKILDLPQLWDIKSDEEASWVENPGGIPGNVLSRLPRVVIIPAESCISELTSNSGALFSLLTELFDQVRKKSNNYEQAQKLLNELANELNPNDSETDFGKLIQDLNGMAHNLFPDSSIHVSASLDQPEKSIKPVFSVEMESNVKTTVPYQGHGIIRATAFQLLRFANDFVNKSSDIPRSTIFCFEEPEIYLHPAAANQMRDALYDLAGANCQIVATTHSPFMVNLGTDRSISLTKFASDIDDFSTTQSFNLEKAFEELQNDERQNLKMLLKVDDYISRMFFAKKCIFVEGDTEEVVIRETIKRLSKEDKARVVGNCEFLRARGKAVLISIAKYLNALDINYIFMHDRDNGTEKAEAMNAPILQQTGEQRRIMIEECIEDILGYPAPKTEKPYKAHAHIQDEWGADFDSLPETWKSVFLRLCAPHLNHLIPAEKTKA
ncbi:MAG: AAA family ATPase [Proteobacteria bacterium]|nr:AAA family ATPase [Pseudomonadota bacterium]